MSIVNDIKTTWKKGKDVALNAPMIERKVKDATSNEKWGPTGTQMQEISRASYNFQDFPIIMGVIWKRINDPGKYWRHVYKSLLLIDYLIRNGSEQVIRECRNHMIEIQTLTEFQHIEEDKDVGLSVRERAKQVIELLHDDKRIKAEREKAKTNRDKYRGSGNDGRHIGGGGYDSYSGGGYGNDSYSSGGGGGGYGHDSYDSYGNGGYDRDSRYDSTGNRHGSDPSSRDSTQDYGRYGSEEGYENPERSYSSGRNSPPPPSRATESRTTSSVASTAGGERRPRAASGGSDTLPPPRPAQQTGDLLGGINDLVSAPANPPPSTDLSLAGLNLGGPVATNPYSTGGYSSAPPTQSFNAFGTPAPAAQQSFNPAFGGFTSAPPAQGDAFDPRGANDGWGDFQSSSAQGGDFNPFSGSGGDFGSAAPPQEPKADDPWQKKGLFNLDQLNSTDPKGAKGATPSPAKVPMAAQATKQPMTKSSSSSTLVPRPAPTTLTPTGSTGSFPAPNYSMGPPAGSMYPPGAAPGMGMGMGMGMGGPGMGGPGMGMGGPGMGMGMGGPGMGGPGMSMGGPGMGMGGPGVGMGMGMGGPGVGMMGGPGMGMGGPGMGMGGPGVGMGGPAAGGYPPPAFGAPNYAAGAGLGAGGPRRY